MRRPFAICAIFGASIVFLGADSNGCGGDTDGSDGAAKTRESMGGCFPPPCDGEDPATTYDFVINATVRDSDGQPLSGVKVNLTATNLDGYIQGAAISVDNGTTDSSGYVRLSTSKEQDEIDFTVNCSYQSKYDCTCRDVRFTLRAQYSDVEAEKTATVQCR